MRIARKIPMVLAIALFMTGCQLSSPMKAFKNKDMQDTLTQSLHSYELTVRWGELNQVYTFLDPELAKATTIQKNLDGIRVTHYEAVKGPAQTSEKEAMQSVKIRYVYEDRQIEKTMIDHQQWTYNPDKREWRRTNPIPKF